MISCFNNNNNNYACVCVCVIFDNQIFKAKKI